LGTAAKPWDDAPSGSTLRRLMFASQKGGVGKTASAVNVAACLGQSGKRTLIVDTDPIGSVSASFGLTLAPGHPGLFGIEKWPLADLVIPEIAGGLDLLPYAEDRRSIDLNTLHAALAELSVHAAADYDFVIIDTRPSVADMTRRLCQVVDEVAVVFQCHPLAYRTLGGILGQLRDARADGAQARLLGLLLTMVDAEDPLQLQLESHIRRSLGQALFPISIPQDAAVEEGVMMDRPAVLYRPDSPAALAYRELTEYLVGATKAVQLG
jgi:chromosome partitioning protein